MFKALLPREVGCDEVAGGGEELGKVFIHIKSKEGDVERVIFADKGALNKIYEKGWETPTLRMNIENGNISKLYKSETNLEKILLISTKKKAYSFFVLFKSRRILNYNRWF